MLLWFNQQTSWFIEKRVLYQCYLLYHRSALYVSLAVATFANMSMFSKEDKVVVMIQSLGQGVNDSGLQVKTHSASGLSVCLQEETLVQVT